MLKQEKHKMQTQPPEVALWDSVVLMSKLISTQWVKKALLGKILY